MSDYYTVSWCDEEWMPIASGEDSAERDRLLMQAGLVEDWKPLELKVDRGPLVDFVANDIGLDLCSQRMRSLIDQHLGPLDSVQWLPVALLDASDTGHAYFVIKVLDRPDVLCRRRSKVLGDDVIIKPAIDLGKVAGREVLAFPGYKGFMVSERLRDELIEAECVGVEFLRVPAFEGDAC